MAENRQSDLLSDVRQFLGFLSGLWGMFSSLTLLFPLSNALVQVLPMHETQRGIYTALTTLTCCFVILYLYITRHQQIAVRLATPSLYDRRVIAIFALGVLSVVVYLPVHSSYVQVLEEPYMVGADLAQGMIWILGMLFYGMSFVGLTTSFTLLAIVEYGKQSGETQDLASRREEVLKTENQELKEKLAELQRHVDRLQERLTHHEQLKAENQQLRQQVAELQSLADDLSTRLAPYEEEKRVLKQNQLVTAVGRITQSAVADTLKQRILEIAGVRDAIVSMTVQRQSRDKGLFYGPGVDRVDTSVFLVLEAGIDISVATRATKSIAEQVLRELKLDAGETSVSVDYAL